jgi:hypothetical protein
MLMSEFTSGDLAAAFKKHIDGNTDHHSGSTT